MRGQQSYYPGSDWLYLKIYGSVMALEEWMIDELFPMIRNDMANLGIDRFFYIRFADPDFHLRLRLHLVDPPGVGKLLTQMNQSIQKWVDEMRIWKMEICTYMPEYERYGAERMSETERFFEIDSTFWLATMNHLRNSSQQDEVWKVAFWHLHNLMNLFKLNHSNQILLLNDSMKGLPMDQSTIKSLKKQLNLKFRREKGILENCLTRSESLFHGMNPLLDQHTSIVSKCVGDLRQTFTGANEDSSRVFVADLLHMSMNRAFRSKHRFQEYVLYYLLSRCLNTLINRPS